MPLVFPLFFLFSFCPWFHAQVGWLILQGTVPSSVEDSFSFIHKTFPIPVHDSNIYHTFQISLQVTAYYFHPIHVWVWWCVWKLEDRVSFEALCYLGQEMPGYSDTSQSNRPGIESLISFLSFSISLYPWPQVGVWGYPLIVQESVLC